MATNPAPAAPAAGDKSKPKTVQIRMKRHRHLRREIGRDAQNQPIFQHLKPGDVFECPVAEAKTHIKEDYCEQFLPGDDKPPTLQQALRGGRALEMDEGPEA